MKLNPRLQAFLRWSLIGCGALAAISSLVNIVGVWQLIDASAEESLGITRGEWIRSYAVMALVGAAMIVVGLRWKK